jgi:hypothetical protein
LLLFSVFFSIWGRKRFIFQAAIAQSVEQRTENPCVGGSIPPCGTSIFAQRKCGAIEQIEQVEQIEKAKLKLR